MVKVLSDLNHHCQIDGQLSIMRWKAWSKEMIIAQCSVIKAYALRKNTHAVKSTLNWNDKTIKNHVQSFIYPYGPFSLTHD